jgi:hypothetical protein
MAFDHESVIDLPWRLAGRRCENAGGWNEAIPTNDQ